VRRFRSANGRTNDTGFCSAAATQKAVLITILRSPRQ
jgi:hypothetical protein